MPDFVQSDHPIFVEFLKDYFSFLEAGRLTVSAEIDFVIQETNTTAYILEETNSDRIVTESGSGSGGKFQNGETITGGTSNATANTNNTGGGGSHENKPPYYALCYIMKT